MAWDFNPLHDLAAAGHEAEHLADTVKNDLLGSASPVPQPGRFTRPSLPQSTWRAQPAGTGGQVTVHRDVLAKTANQIRGDVQSLDQAMGTLASAAPGGSTITGWPTADGLSGNVTAVSQSMSNSSALLSAAHKVAAGKLGVTADTYDTAETDTVQAIRGVAGNLGGAPR
jgi:hypothetical protein